jgi:hypothetical protein
LPDPELLVFEPLAVGPALALLLGDLLPVLPQAVIRTMNKAARLIRKTET